MTPKMQSRNFISRTRLRAASDALASAILLAVVAFATPSAQAQTYTVLHDFTGGADGANPLASLIQDSAGNLYGTTENGGAANCKNFGGSCGTIFKIDTSGNESILHSFSGSPDGAVPVSGLVQDADGNFYGTTYRGGTGTCAGLGCGTAFKMDNTGAVTVLHMFVGPPDGNYPMAGLLLAPGGNLYGTTEFGGRHTFDCNGQPGGCGMVFELNPATGHEVVLYSFKNNADGGFPVAGLIQVGASFYGTTSLGGIDQGGQCDGGEGPAGCGAVFRISKTGAESGVHDFGATQNGIFPAGGVIADSDGNLYGATAGGGNVGCDNPFGCGTVFEINAKGKESVLYRFRAGEGGKQPQGSLVRDSAGNLYGVTGSGGNSTCNSGNGCGVVFKVDPTGKETVLHQFGGSDGEDPRAGLVMDASGNLYGTTQYGGTSNDGVVFKITP